MAETKKAAAPKKATTKTTTTPKKTAPKKSTAIKAASKTTAPKKKVVVPADQYCQNCGNGLAADAEFCLKCGKLVGGNTTPKASSDINNKVFNILSYIGILWLIGMFCEAKNDKSVRFHVGQGILISILEVAVGLINGLVIKNIFVTRYTYWYYTYTQTSTLGYVLMVLLSLIPLAFAVLGIINAVKQEDKELPIIGKWAFYK